MRRMHITEESIKTLETTGKAYIVFDTEFRGLAVRVGSKGRISFYFVNYRKDEAHKNTQWLQIGVYPVVTVDEVKVILKEKETEIVKDRMDKRGMDKLRRFTPVLVRNHKEQPWSAQLLLEVDKTKPRPYKTALDYYRHCMPLRNNEEFADQI